MATHPNSKHKNMRSVDDALGTSSNQFRYLFGGLDIFGIKPFEIYDSFSYMNDYMKNRGLSWSDMKYPTLAKYSGYGSSAINADFDVIDSLYNDENAYVRGSKNALRRVRVPRGGRVEYW